MVLFVMVRICMQQYSAGQAHAARTDWAACIRYMHACMPQRHRLLSQLCQHAYHYTNRHIIHWQYAVLAWLAVWLPDWLPVHLRCCIVTWFHSSVCAGTDPLTGIGIADIIPCCNKYHYWHS